ncbi:hypothetical protein FRB94_002355 [Tulasnella sp. JGI-2019a]|nr:hypothetical protein FRB94_002355 [Tulasnella sp. JGI-2019a]
MAQSNNTPHPAAHMVRYVFPSDTFNGSMIEDAGGNTVYRITTKTKLSGSTTTITRPDETPVGVIRWRYLFRPMAVTLNGKEIPKKQVLYTQRSGFFSAPKQLWTDDDGKEFHWKRGSVSSLRYGGSSKLIEYCLLFISFGSVMTPTIA